MDWDEWFLKRAEVIAMKSKDPSTKVGCIIVNKEREVMGSGYNGFPKRIKDLESLYANREEKYKRVLHAEQNAILLSRSNLEGCTAYVFPLFPCGKCALELIQSGITRVVAPTNKEERWKESTDFAKELFNEAGIDVEEIG